MVIIINPYAGGGKAVKKWKKIESNIYNQPGPVKVIFLNEKMSMRDCVSDLLKQNHQNFIAGGGDGTINLLLQNLINLATPSQLTKIKIGAIGLGSSNDFHKPFRKQHKIKGIPYKINFASAEARDVGILTFIDKKENKQKKYWLINASMGITAEANHFFNTPDSVLHFLKRIEINSAILYAALCTIFSYRNRSMTVRIGNKKANIINLTNMGVVKSPHFSGNFSYNTPFLTDNGFFYINICRDMHILNTLNILWNLSKNRFCGLANTESVCSDRLTVESDFPFAVEFDGEVITARKANFNLKQKMIRICIC
jgi:diacylglycerol kinase family enzyme